MAEGKNEFKNTIKVLYLYKMFNKELPEFLQLSDYQKHFLEFIKRKMPVEHFLPWQRGKVLSAAGIVAGGWYDDENFLLVSNECYTLFDVNTGNANITNYEANINDCFSSDNLNFQIIETNKIVKVFGLRGGNGNQLTLDGWKLQVMYPAWSNSVVAVTQNSFALDEEFHLVKLQRLEYFDLYCGFAPNQQSFAILGSGGAELFKR